MPFAARLPKVGDRREYFNERTWRCYHQTPPLERVVAQVWDAGQAKPHLEHNPLAPLGVCHAIPIRKLNGPGALVTALQAALPTLEGLLSDVVQPLVPLESLDDQALWQVIL